MPTYDYECSNGHRFEYLQSITAEPLTACVTCGEPVRRLIGGGAGIIFKGSGFYVTDSKNGSGKKAAAKGEDGNKGTDKATDKAKDKASKADAKSGSDSSSSSGGDKPAKTAAAS